MEYVTRDMHKSIFEFVFSMFISQTQYIYVNNLCCLITINDNKLRSPFDHWQKGNMENILTRIIVIWGFLEIILLKRF